MFGRNAGFTRWYDSVPELAQAVRLMEKIQPTHQHAIAQVIVDTTDTTPSPDKADPGLKKLGTEKIMGLMKSKTKRRWYDQDPIVHQAFNLIYMMEEAGRREIGLKIIFSIKVIEEAQGKTQNPTIEQMLQGPKKLDVGTLVKVVFLKDTEYLANRTTLSAPQPIEKPERPKLPPLDEREPTELSDSLDHTTEGLKIIRLKKNQYRSLG